MRTRTVQRFTSQGLVPTAHHLALFSTGLAASATSGHVTPEEITDIGTGGGEGSKVFLFNCECHSFEDVITQLLKAVPGMTRSSAEELAWRVHTQGLAEVYRGGSSECERVAKILGETGLIVQVL